MTTLIRCGQLIDGLGRCLSDAAIDVEDGNIVDVTPWSPDITQTAQYERILDFGEHSVLPGLIEAHGHMGLLGPGLEASPAEIAAQVFHNVRQALEEGFTTVRDAGGIDGGVAACVDSGIIVGPKILPSGPFLTQTGGHADGRSKWTDHRTGMIPGLVRVALVCDSPNDVRRAVRDAFRHGSTQIKVCISGGVSSGSDLNQCQFSVDELRSAVAEATAHNSYVHAHAHSSASIAHGISAGIRHFEHGSLLDRQTAELMHGVGASLVPTMLVLKRLIDTSDQPRPELDALLAAMRASIKIADDAGVPLGSGSDLLGVDQRGRAEEIALKAEILGPMAAITSATSVNAAIIGIDEQVGSIVPGKRADLLVVAGDPLRDPAVLADRDAICEVFRSGRPISSSRT